MNSATHSQTDNTFALIDQRLVEDTYFLQRKIEPVVLKQPEPVLGDGIAYGTVLRERNGDWRMYYLRRATDSTSEIVTDRSQYREALAFSKDGLHWETPSLGLVESNGSRDNNLVMAAYYRDTTGRDITGSSGPEGFCVKDAEQDNIPHARSRFTAMYLARPEEGGQGLYLAHSDDGLTWTGAPQHPIIPGWHDTQNVFFYDERTQKYVMYLRPPIHAGPRESNRMMARSESADLINWSLPEVVLTTDELDAPAFDFFEESKDYEPRGRTRQVYGLHVFPYNDLYIGLARMYDVPSGVLWIELIHSYDSIEWRREAIREPYITAGNPAGLSGKMITMFGSPPIAVGDELWLYGSTVETTHHQKSPPDELARRRIFLTALKRDRWIGYAAGERSGELLTKPFDCAGKSLSLNAVIEADGEIAVKICNEWGKALSEPDTEPIATLRGPLDDLAAPISIGQFANSGPIRLRIGMRHARLFGWALS